MRNPEQILENLNKQSVKHCKVDSFKFNELYKHFFNPLFYEYVHDRLCENKSSVDDGKSIGGIQKIIESMRNESYQPKPAGQRYDQKEPGKGLPTLTDRYIQQIVCEMLSIIYEPIFSTDSYGFRQGLNCHNAIYAIQTTFQGAVWFIEGDVKPFFNSIDHHIMIEVLRQKIDDERFIRLIWKLLKAGYLEDWKFNSMYSKTPKGRPVSQMLANIYLNELDKHIDRLKDGAWGYNSLANENKQLRKQHISSAKEDSDSRNHLWKLRYVRYAGDFILGIIGSRKEAENIKQDIEGFLRGKLNLDLSHKKLLISHSSSKARFLLYEISIYQKGAEHKKASSKNGILELNYGGKGQIRLTMPRSIIIKKLKELNLVEDFNADIWKPRRNTKIISKSDLEIMEFYNEQIRGLYNYFRLAANVSLEMNKFYHIMKTSMFHTLAAKYKSTIPKMLKKYRLGDTTSYGIAYEDEQGIQIQSFYHDGFKRNLHVDNNLIDDKLDCIPNM